MIKFFLIFITVKFLTADLCTIVNTYDCEAQYNANESEDVCGTDGVWYHNYCYYAQAKCKNETLDILYVGPCDQNLTDLQNSTYKFIDLSIDDSNKTTVATTTPTTTTTTFDTIKQIFCSAVFAGSVKCIDELDPYCGTDGNWYKNNCEFEKQSCYDTTLKKQDLNLCKQISD